MGGGDDDVDDVNCATVTDDDDFVVGLVKPGDGGVLEFTLMSGNPAPPIRGDNEWVVQVRALAGGSLATDAAVSVTPFMPAHGHGAGKTAEVVTMPDAGQYKLTPINLWMPGVWETTVDVQSAAGDDKVVFKFCIPS